MEYPKKNSVFVHEDFEKWPIRLLKKTTLKYVSLFKIPDYRNAIIVARTPGQAKRATAYAERLRLGIAVIHGDLEIEKDNESMMANDGNNSPPSAILNCN